MAKKIIMGICISIILAGFSWFFINGEFDSSAITGSSYDIVVGTEAGDVIQQGDTIINLARLEEFYKNIRREIDDEMTIAIVHSQHNIDLYELIFENNQLKLYYDIAQDEQGRKEYKIKIYQSIKKILKGNQVIYKLVNENEERPFLAYNLK